MPPTVQKSSTRFIALIVALGVAALSCGAQAQPIQMSPELKAFLTRPDEQQQFGGMMQNLWHTTVDNCPKPTVKGMNVLIGVAPKFNASGMPVSGQWTVVGQFEGCGIARRFNILYAFGPDRQMRRIGLLPGSTVGNLKLQQDSLMYAAMGMTKLRPKDCKDTKYIDTRFIAFDGGDPPPSEIGKRAWTEEWTVRTCDITGLVTMHFAPNATGTNISSDLSKTRRVSP